MTLRHTSILVQGAGESRDVGSVTKVEKLTLRRNSVCDGRRHTGRRRTKWPAKRPSLVSKRRSRDPDVYDRRFQVYLLKEDMRVNLLLLCDETNRVAGLSDWWSTKGLLAKRVTFCLRFGFEG